VLSWLAALDQLDRASERLMRTSEEDDTELAQASDRRAEAVWRLHELIAQSPTSAPREALNRIEAALRQGEGALHRFRILRAVTVHERQNLEAGERFLRDAVARGHVVHRVDLAG